MENLPDSPSNKTIIEKTMAIAYPSQ